MLASSQYRRKYIIDSTSGARKSIQNRAPCQPTKHVFGQSSRQHRRFAKAAVVVDYTWTVRCLGVIAATQPPGDRRRLWLGGGAFIIIHFDILVLLVLARCKGTTTVCIQIDLSFIIIICTITLQPEVPH
jgi:hypothetical protein